MATIGLSVESGSVYAVLFDAASDAVVANRVTPLDGGIAEALPAAVDGMRAAARRRRIDVDAVGVVYSSDAERDRVATVVDNGDLGKVSLYPASKAFLGWLARSSEFADVQRVLLYYMGDSGVSISLADAATSRLSQAKTATLDSLGPERIGSTVPLAWEVLDGAGVKADVVALFGDRSSNRDLVDILALGLGIPVVRVADADQVAARGAALLAAESVPAEAESVAPAPVVAAPPVLVAPAASIEAVSTAAARRALPRKKLVIGAAVLAAVLSGGVALASTLPGDDATTAAPTETESSDPTGIETNLAGATSSVVTAEPPTTEVLPPAPPQEPPVVAPQPAYTPDPVTWEPSWTPAPVVAQGPIETMTPIPAQSIPANAAVVPHSAVEAPQFTVPPIIPEAGKSQEQLEQEAWDRHWQHTAEWLEQEIVGN